MNSSAVMDRQLLESLLERLLPADTSADFIRHAADTVIARQLGLDAPQLNHHTAGAASGTVTSSFATRDALRVTVHGERAGGMTGSTAGGSSMMGGDIIARPSNEYFGHGQHAYQSTTAGPSVTQGYMQHPEQQQFAQPPHTIYQGRGGISSGQGPAYFRPIRHMLNPPQSSLPPHTQHINAIVRTTAGFSANYQGEISDKNRSANIPANRNCALFIKGLPPTLTVTQLLGAIRNIGRVYQTHINPPAGRHRTCAAKLIFFERRAAEAFMARFAQGFQIPGYPGHTAQVAWNRVLTGETFDQVTRVLLISGPRDIVHPFRLTEYFRTKIYFDIDEVFEFGEGNRYYVEYRFGSYRAQAELARMALLREMANRGVQVRFGLDPCGM
jgi:hypothetical protein